MRDLRKYLVVIVMGLFLLLILLGATPANSKSPPKKSKFYDFSEQVIDGEIRRPTALYTDARQKARFERLLRLKKSFLPNLFVTAKEKVFK